MSKNEIVPMSMEAYVEKFAKVLTVGFAQLVTAAGVYVSAIDDPNVDNEVFRAKCQEQCPGLPKLIWRSIEEVGRGQVHPDMLLYSGENSAKIRRLPLSVQTEITEGMKFELLTVDGDTLKVDVRQIGTQWARQIFAKDHIRTIAEQKAWLAANMKPVQEEPTERLNYQIVGGKVHFRKATVLDKTEIRRLLMEM